MKMNIYELLSVVNCNMYVCNGYNLKIVYFVRYMYNIC